MTEYFINLINLARLSCKPVTRAMSDLQARLTEASSAHVAGLLTEAEFTTVKYRLLDRLCGDGLTMRSELQLRAPGGMESSSGSSGSRSSAVARTAPRSDRPVRIFMEGAFDIMHYGHMNAFRLGAGLFPNTQLIVGVNSAKTIAECKGPPIMTDDERCDAVRGCRFVDEVIPRTPYVMTKDYLMALIEEHDLDFVVHGDDPCIVDGEDVYAVPKKLGKFCSIPRTEGVSTTDIVGRMLLVSRDHHRRSSAAGIESGLDAFSQDTDALKHAFASTFISTTSLISTFGGGPKKRVRKATDKVVYIDGAFDMFHAGHIAFIESARAAVENAYIVVGVHDDETVNQYRGRNYPIMNLQERLLSVLGCKHVDDVVICAPWIITEELIASLDIHVVAHGTSNDPNADDGDDRYACVKKLGKFLEIPSTCTLSVDAIVSRIAANEERFAARFLKKMASEKEYYEARYGTGGEEGADVEAGVEAEAEAAAP